MRARFGREWMDTYNSAFRSYIKGHWRDAESGFRKILQMKSDDKPTLNLLEFMSETNMKPPPGWNGTKVFVD